MAGKYNHGLEGKRFLQIRNLAHRWDCGTSRIYDLVSKQVLIPWHPEGKTGQRGLLIDVRSILDAEDNGFNLD